MAILKSLIVRGGRKQIGGMVLYSRNGETIARELAAQVTNPRTPAQMEQRVRLSNLVAVYRANASWMRGAFENKKDRESDYNAFVSANVGNNAVALSKSDVAAGAAVVGNYKITSGSLPIIETVLNGNDLVSNLYVGSLSVTESTTIADLSTALLANNNGLEEGMQISIVINLQLAAAGSGVPYVTVRAYEMIINTEDSTTVEQVVPDGILESVGTGTKALAIKTNSLGDGAAAFIISKTIGGRTQVSTQSLVFFGSNATYRNYTSTTAWNRAIASYGEGMDTFLSSASANTANSVASTLALLGVDYNSTEYVAGGTLEELMAAADEINFLFNKALPADAVVSAYYQLGTAAQKYQLTNVTVAQDRRSLGGVIGSTSLATDSQLFTLVAVVDGDEFPIQLRNAHEGMNED